MMLLNLFRKRGFKYLNKIPDLFWKFKTVILLILQCALFIFVALLFEITTPQLQVFFALFLVCHVVFGSTKFIVSYLGAAYFVSHVKRSWLFIILLLIYSSTNRVSYEELLRIFVAFMCIEILQSCAYLVASRVLFERRFEVDNQTPIVIWGAGYAGRSFLSNQKSLDHLSVVAFIDDDKEKIGSVYGDVKVYGRNDIQLLKSRWENLRVYLAVPSLKSDEISEILSFLKHKNCDASVLPHYVSGQTNVTSTDFVSLDIDALIGRPQTNSKLSTYRYNIDDMVLVTGGGGSIGLELVKSCVSAGARKLVILDQSEYNLYKAKEVCVADGDFVDVEISYELCDVRDFTQLKNIFASYEFDYVYHAAAYKHVPIVESNIISGIKNNILGTENVASLAGEYKVKKFVLVSTDKAVRPTNVMGATKRFAELIVGSLIPQYPKTIYSMVRFGNVVGSSGSVIPMFQQQIDSGGPVTVTHKEITRFFMSIKEASDLVSSAAHLAKGGEVFILDMGSPIQIFDLAVNMIKQSGHKVKTDEDPKGIEVVFTGLRPGEKLYEELLVDRDALATEHPKIFKANESQVNAEMLEKSLQILKSAVSSNDVETILAQLKVVVEGYQHKGSYGD